MPALFGIEQDEQQKDEKPRNAKDNHQSLNHYKQKAG